MKRNFPKYSSYIIDYIANDWEKGLLNKKRKYEIIGNLSRYMTTTGDDQLTRVHYHVAGCNYHMSEQVCETNGYEIGAWDLTWSYGTFLSAWYYRSQAIAAGAFPMPREMAVDWNKIYNGVGDNFCAGCSSQCGD